MKLSLSTVFAVAAARELDLDNAMDRLALIEEKFEVRLVQTLVFLNIFSRTSKPWFLNLAATSPPDSRHDS